MNETTDKHPVGPRTKPADRKGIALILTVAILVILTTIIYSLTTKVLVQKRRQEYIINYQQARYACDSAMKYALTRIDGIEMTLIKREDYPDFSDMFALDHEQYIEMLNTWKEEKRLKLIKEGKLGDTDVIQEPNMVTGMMDEVSGNPNTGDTLMDDLLKSIDSFGESTDVNDMVVPGPYGQPWPQVSESVELEIGDAKVEITFNDENAKFPLTLMLMKDEKLTRVLDNAMLIFCEWMQMDIEDIEILAFQLQEVAEKKEYSLKMEPIVLLEKPNAPPVETTPTRPVRRSRVPAKTQPATAVKKTTRPEEGHVADFAKILHSSKVNMASLAKPLPGLVDRYESPLKYLGIWGTDKVNINTAPRHVLEAIFALGGDQANIADGIIRQRQIKPFEKVEELRNTLYQFNDSIEKVKPYLITKSDYITVEVHAVCGNAKAASVTIIKKTDKKHQQIGLLSI